MRSSNPFMKKNAFRQQGDQTEQRMTIHGTVDKTLILLFLLLGAACFSWNSFYEGTLSIGSLYGCLIGAFVVALVTGFARQIVPYTAPIYALLEGFALGGVSAMYEAQFAGITTQAVLLTIGVLFVLLTAYRLRIIQATKTFRTGILIATGAVFFTYLINFILHFFGMNVPFLHDTGPIGIGVSVVILIIASLNFILDFAFIEEAVEAQAPKTMEWYGAFGLILTLVWVYIEILHLLSKLRSND